jgi:hypothetical protein
VIPSLDGSPQILINQGNETARSRTWPIIYVKTANVWTTVIEMTSPLGRSITILRCAADSLRAMVL